MNPLRLFADLLYRFNQQQQTRQRQRRQAAAEVRHRQTCLACRDRGDSHA